MNELTEGDVYALLTEVRDGLLADGYVLDIVATAPRISLAIQAGPDACDDCLVGKDVMVTYVVQALREMSPTISPEDVSLLYPNETAATNRGQTGQV